jgi:ubiquitin-protein ligase
MSAGRVKKEISIICKTDPTSGVIATLAPDDNAIPDKPGWRHLIGTITGPSGTPYENGVFDVDILIDGEYPFVPPKMKFITKIWHPNVSSQTGAICLVSVLLVYDDVYRRRSDIFLLLDGYSVLTFCLLPKLSNYLLNRNNAILCICQKIIYTKTKQSKMQLTTTGHSKRSMDTSSHHKNCHDVSPSAPLLSGTK